MAPNLPSPAAAPAPSAPASAGGGTRSAGERWLLAGLLVLFVLVAGRVAWLGDDAYISFRTVHHLASGDGPVWNLGERVQAYTNALWVLLLAPAYALTGEIYFTALAYGLAFSLAAVAVAALRLGRTAAAGALVVAACCASKAFVEYSTSGLENPLVHLLLALSLVVFLKREAGPRAAFLQALLAALLAMTRFDSLVLTGPLLAAQLAARPRPGTVARMALGFTPFVLWEAFSLVYYGFPVPNTAYGKLSTGLPRSELLGQGLNYLANSLLWDPATLALVAVALIAVVLRGNTRERIVGAAMVLHVGYVVSVGGDFMSGRFLTPVFFCAVILLGRRPWSPRGALLAGAVVLALGVWSERSPLRTGGDFGRDWARDYLISPSGISDERATYFQYTGLYTDEWLGGLEPFGHVSTRHPQATRLIDQGVRVQPSGWIGIVGYWLHSEPIYLLDKLGLADPLHARLPIWRDGRVLYARNAIIPGHEWRIGHYYREMPVGYVKTLEALYDPARDPARRTLEEGENVIRSEALRAYYDKLDLIVHGPLWSRARLSAIWWINTGGGDELIDAYAAEVAEGRL